MHDTAYLATTCRKRVHTSLDTSEDNVVFVYLSDGFNIFIINWEKPSTQKKVDPKNDVKRKFIDSSEAAYKF
jgi:hypothetical protein